MDFLGVPFNELTLDVLSQLKIHVIGCMDISYQSILNVTNNRCFENTVVPLIKGETIVEPYVQTIDYVMNLHPDESMRELASELQKQIEEKFVEYSMRKDIYLAFNEYYKHEYKTEKNTLNGEERRYFEHTMNDLRRNGLDLDDQQIEEIKSIKQKISNLSIQFTKNINDDNTTFEFTRDQLRGIPPTWFDDAELIEGSENAGDDIFKVTLKYPDFFPIIDYVNDENVRKQMYFAFNSRCVEENTPLLKEIMTLRSQLATKLNYKTYADYSTEDKIIKTSQNAINFLSNLNELFDPLYKMEMADLLKFARNYNENPLKKTSIDRWDIRYYSRAYKESLCDLDLQEVREYFPLTTVRDGMFHIYEHLLGLKFHKLEGNTNKWHNTVELFNVTDHQTNELIGHFYMDMYPRDGKYGHAAAFPLINRCHGYGLERLPVVSIVCNFPENQCIEFEDVVTLFHEFGHAMHMICGKNNLSAHGGLDTEIDFVECPSQMLEFWCYCEESLALMSSHTLTGEHLPLALIVKLQKYKNLLQGYHNKRQILLGLFDLNCHSLAGSTQFDPKFAWDQAEKSLGFLPHDDFHFYASFDHITSDYAAGYYGYLLSESYATCLFYKKFKDGHILDQNVGLEYRKKLLEPGSSIDGSDLLRNFLGEEPNNIYFSIEKGIKIQ